jgi:tetratricopeptide (TPR) repeat protein
MWLPRFSDSPRACAIAPLLVFAALAGCASGPHAAGDDAVPRDARVVPPEARTRFEQAVAVMAAGDLTEAALRFDAFLLQHPGYPGAHVNLAIIHAEQARDEAVERSIVDALDIDPDHAAALNQLGMLRRRQGRFEEAEAAYLKAVTADPGYALAHYNLGVLYELYLQQLEPALRHFERYQQLGGNDEQVAKWIVDLSRRVGALQQTANMRE